MRRSAGLALVVLVVVGIWGARARADESPVAKALALLRRQVDLIEAVRPYVEREDLGRLVILKQASTRVLDSIKDKGPFHTNTLKEYQSLILTHRYSKVYIKAIETESTEGFLKELQEITEFFAKEYGFDDSPYTQVTASVFNQIHKLVLQLLQLQLIPDLRRKLEDLKAPIGELIAIAKQGDDYPTLQAAIPRCRSLRALYADFYKVASSDAAFELTLEVQGLNEWYIERSRIPTWDGR